MEGQDVFNLKSNQVKIMIRSESPSSNRPLEQLANNVPVRSSLGSEITLTPLPLHQSSGSFRGVAPVPLSQQGDHSRCFPQPPVDIITKALF